MNTYSKTIHYDDWVEEIDHVRAVQGAMSNVAHRFEHRMRAWEYGLVLNALRKAEVKTVLDVGGGGSIFAPACEWPDISMKTTTVDMGDVGKWIKKQAKLIEEGGPKVHMEFIQEDFLKWKSKRKFDAVACISTIEHTDKPEEFFVKLLGYVNKGGILALTTDFHPSGLPQVDGHVKTYNEIEMQRLAAVAMKKGFEFYGGAPNWSYFHPQVNNYTFASLVMEKK